jgi:hypothetical protein
MVVKSINGNTYSEVAVVSAEPLEVSSGLGIPLHDYVANTYTTGNLTQTVFKVGGSGGTVVATLDFTYDGNNNLLTVTRS